MRSVLLSGNWKLWGRREDECCGADACVSLTATVPGTVALDLSREGYLPADLYMGMNITECEKYERYEWWYERDFEFDGGERPYLVFDGVDCIAEYFLNGILIGKSDNMLIPHEFDVQGVIKRGKNTLTVHIKSPIIEAEKYDYPLILIGNWNNESRYVRRAPHSWGWDIMPRAVSCGIFRDVRLELRDSIYLSQSFMHAPSERCTYYYTLDSNGAQISDVELEISAACGDSSFCVRRECKWIAGSFSFNIPNVKRWYPRGYGDSAIYDGSVRLYRSGELVSESPISFGVRTVVLERREHDGEVNGTFKFIINGTEIMCKGTNWVPLDAFHSRDRERYGKALELVLDIGCNILRCWGGNVYEEDSFFDFCDRNGIMIWQDFAMACARYPETDEFKERLRREAVSVIRRLRSHPSIILWAGDNEVDALHSYDPDTNSLTRELLPKCVLENDIDRPYIASSPYISGASHRYGMEKLGRRPAPVEDHIWGPRDYFKSDFYKNNRAAFVSEMGYHGCPSLESIRKFITPERVWPYRANPEWILHSSDQCGNDARVMLMEKQVRQLFGTVPSEPEDYVLSSQISQAEAKKYFIERVRVDRPRKTGIIWWNLLDGWPQMSDAVVDYYFEKKLAYGYIKRSQKPFIIAAGEIANWQLPIYACNDTLGTVCGKLTVRDADSGKVMVEKSFTAAPNTSTCVMHLPVYYSDRGALIFEWETGADSGYNHYLLGYPPYSLNWYKRFMERYGLDK